MCPRIVTRLTSSMAGSAELVRGQPRPDSGLPATCPVVGQVAAWRRSCRAAVAPAARSMVREVVLARFASRPGLAPASWAA